VRLSVGEEELLRYTGGGVSGELGEVAAVVRTLQARFDHVKGMNSQRGCGASGEASDGLNQRGREARMVVIHRAMGMAWLSLRGKKKIEL